MSRTARATLGLIAALLAGALTACGSSSDAGRPTVRVALDFTPNAVHAPIYSARRNGFDGDAGVRLQIRPPGAGPDAVKLVTTGRVDMAVLDIHDLGLARERGVDLVGIGALVQRPLGALIARPGVSRPRDLEGRRVGVSGLPSDPAFVRAIVEHDGGDFDEVRQVTIGFNAVGSLIAGKIDAAPAFWNAEGVVLRERGVRTREFRVESYGAPRYPEVVLIATRETLERRREDLSAALEAIRRGALDTLAHPEPAIREIAAAGDADPKLVRAQLEAVAPAVRPPLRLDRRTLERWADFDARVGLLRQRPDVGKAFDLTLVD